MPAVITERELAAACRETLRQWPQARAAVLFGSRARGTARPDSDWDVAIVLEGGALLHPRPARSVFPRSELPADLPHVDVWALSEEDLFRNSHALGTLPYVVCRDGRVLAGDWNRPDPARMRQEAAVNPEDWTYRMERAAQKVDAAMTQIGKLAEAPLWAVSGTHCADLLEITANAAELLVKAAIERRGVPADRSDDIAGLAAAFVAQRPDERALAQQMAALNGDSRAHHTAMYRFRPPEEQEARAAVERLAATLALWASEIEKRNDAVAAQFHEPARAAAFYMAAWPDLMSKPVTPRPDDGHPAQSAAEAVLKGRSELAEAIASFRDRVRRVIDGPAPGDDLPSPTPFD